MKLKHLFTALSVLVLASLLSVTSLAAERANYEINLSYAAANTTTSDVALVPFKFDKVSIADDSVYQPNTAFSRMLDGEELEIEGTVYKTVPANSTKTVTDTWTFSNGGFEQNPLPTATYKKALKAYTSVTESIVYGKPQKYALPEIATCESFASAFCDMLAADGVRFRKVFGYTPRLMGKNSELTYCESDITENPLHVWVEWYDDDTGVWIFCDPTFDAGRAKFAFYGRCPDSSPHLAMYYDYLPKRYISKNAGITWKKTVTLTRYKYIDTEGNNETLLDTAASLETDAAVLNKYADAKGLTITLCRAADIFSLMNSVTSFVPSSSRIAIGDLVKAGASLCVALQLSETDTGAFRLRIN